MRRLVFSLFLGMLYLGFSPSWAQTPKIQKDVDKKLEQVRAEEKKKASADPESVSLDKLIAEGLKYNPDVRVAEVRVREAEVALDRARLKLVAEISTAHAEVQAVQATLDEAQERFQVMDKLFKNKAISPEDQRTAFLTLLKAKSELIASQSRLPYLLGRQQVDRKDDKAASTGSEPDNLKHLVKEGLKNNPDVRVAESRVKEAEALLQQTRIRAAAEIAGLQADIDAAQASLNEARVRADVATKLQLNRAISVEEHRTAMLTLAKMKREVVVHRAKMPYLLGKQTMSRREAFNVNVLDVDLKALDFRLDSSRTVAQDEDALKRSIDKLDASMADKLRKALDKPVTPPANFLKLEITEFLNFLSRNLPGLIVREDSFKDHPVPQDGRKLFFFAVKDTISMGAFLQFLEDEMKVVFVVRDYGVVVLPVSRVPPGAIRVYDFWKLGKAEKRP